VSGGYRIRPKLRSVVAGRGCYPCSVLCWPGSRLARVLMGRVSLRLLLVFLLWMGVCVLVKFLERRWCPLMPRVFCLVVGR